MRTWIERMLAAGAALLLVLLAGCANTAATRSPAGLQLDLSAKPHEGYVVLRVVTLRPISALNPKWQSVNIVAANGRRDEIHDVTPQFNMLQGRVPPTESLYFAKLPEGEYRVTGLASIGPGPGLIPALIGSDNAAAGKQLPAFSVRAGRLANLGTLVFSPEIEKEQASRMLLLHGPVGQRSALDALLADASRPGTGLEAGGGWLVPPSSQPEAATLAQARQLASAGFVRAGPRGLLAGTHLGQVLRRTAPGVWSREGLDTLSTIFTVVERPDGRVIAGGEHGAYFVRGADGAWRSFRIAQAVGRTAWIEPRPDGSTLFVTGDQRGSRVWLKRGLEDNDAATEIAKLEGPPDLVLATGRELLLARNEPGITRETVITRIDKQSLAVSTQREKFWVAEWQSLATGQILLTRQNGLSFYRSTGTEGSRAWTHTETPASFSTWWMDPTHAFALDWTTGLVMVGNHPRRTADGGRTWERAGTSFETRGVPGRVLYAGPDEVLLQRDHMLYSSLDQGRSWKRALLPTAR